MEVREEGLIIMIIYFSNTAPGYFTFRLCPVEAEAEATQECMDRNVLRLALTVMIPFI